MLNFYFHVFLLPNLAKSSYVWSPLCLHHKIEKEKEKPMGNTYYYKWRLVLAGQLSPKASQLVFHMKKYPKTQDPYNLGMGNFISVQCSEWACSCTKCFEWYQILFGYKDELVRYLQKHSHTTLHYWIKVSLIDSCWKGIHIISTPIEDAQLNKFEALETISKIVCSKWLVPTSWVWSMEVMSTYLKNPTMEKALWHHHSIMNKVPKQFVWPSL